VAVASAGPFASLYLAPDRQPRQHPTTEFVTGQMPSLPPNQQRQSTESTQITQEIYFLTAVSSLVISKHNSFRLLFDTIASVYFI